MEKEEITIELLYRKLENRLTEEEVKHFEMWMQDIDHQRYYQNLQSFYELREDGRPDSAEVNRAWIDLQSRINKQGAKTGRNRLLWCGVVAASIIILLGVIPLIVPQDVKNVSSEAEIQIRPGQRNAILELADGKVYNLTNLEYGGNNRISENIIVDSCCLDYLRPDTLIPVALAWHKVIVPRGGEFQISLEDGTRVWLNSESTLKYPEVFTGTTREVFLEGEAYFEVARNTNCPFIVHTGIQNVRVLGTSFGITNYADDQNLTTTLVNGKVQVEFPGFSDEVFLLEPGFQLACDRQNRKIEKRTVDVYEYVAWKDGKYVFTRKRLEDILTTLSRWYDFHVFFQNPEVKEVVFSGELRRFDSFSDILRLIEKTSDVKFTTTGNTVLVRE